MSKRKFPTWLILIPVALVLLFVSIPVFMMITAETLYPDPAAIPAFAHIAPQGEALPAVDRARKAAREGIAGQNLPGLSVAVAKGDAIVWAEGFGYADLRQAAPVTPEHRFPIGTASEALTSAAAALLIEGGRLRMDEEIQTYVPAFPRKQWPVTVRQLMAHTSGLEHDGGDENPLLMHHCVHPAEAVPIFSGMSLAFQPGTQFRRSSYGWILLSAAIETASGQPFLGFMKERVFEPLSLDDTVPARRPDPDPEGEDFPLVNLFRELVADPEAKRPSAPAAGKQPVLENATSYFPRLAANPKHGLHIMRPLDTSCYAGAGAFLATPSDLVRFAVALRGGKLLRKETVEFLHSPQDLASGEDTGYGLGWSVRTVSLGKKEVRAIGVNGYSVGGMVATLLILPEHGLTVAVTSNISYAATDTLALQVAEAFAAER